MADFAPSTGTGSSPADPRKFGRVDQDGRVFVKEGDTEREVGSYPDGIPDDPLALYVRRFLDLEAAISLFESRLAQLAPREMDSSLSTFQEQLKEPMMVGDLQALRERVTHLVEVVAARKVQLREEREAAKAKALAERTEVVERAEALTSVAPEKIQWKKTGEELRQLMDRWKELQKTGPRLDKASEDALWKRFSTCRSTFDKGRRQFFATQNELHHQVKKVKEKLVAEAESLQNSENWRETATAYKDLMDRWRKAGRASRKDDDALWEKFRSAQQTFFDRLHAHEQEVDLHYQQNLSAKLEIVKQAQDLLPVQDLESARTKFREFSDQINEIGPVPYKDRQLVDEPLRQVERALKEAEEKEWRRPNPETQARAQGVLAQLEEQLEKLQADLESAQTAGDEKRAKQISEALDTKRAWLEQVRQSVE